MYCPRCANLAADAVITPRHTLTYQDSNGNPYQGQ